MTDLEGSSDALKVHYKRRENPVENCYTAAIEHKMSVFGIQDGGQCFGSQSMQAAKQYGSSSACSSGKGGPMANNVYELSKCISWPLFKMQSSFMLTNYCILSRSTLYSRY